ncbi:MAG TPA: PAAR-like protein, partial [Candidatus Binatia bacterium]|nr:PAAR-like protein [Candidatus Binatia bacterium]
WTPGALTVLLGGMPALDNTSTLMCMWGGVITVLQPGEVTEQIP